MITPEQVSELLVQACPSFRAARDETVKLYGEETPYGVAGPLAHHLLSLFRVADTREFAAVGAIIERFHVEGDHYVAEFATIGILEGIQNVWASNGVNPDEFAPFLGPVSRTWWSSLNRFWRGELRYVGEDVPPN